MAVQRPLVTMEILQDQVLIVIGKKPEDADDSETSSSSEVEVGQNVCNEIEKFEISCKDEDIKQENNLEGEKSVCKFDGIKHEDKLGEADESIFAGGIKTNKDETKIEDENKRNLQANCEDANEDDAESHVSDKSISTCSCNTCKNWENSEHNCTHKDNDPEEETCKHTYTKVWLPVTFLSAESEFFNSACSGRWGCGDKREIHLVEEDPEIFAIFVFWLFNRKIEDAPELSKIGWVNLDCKDCVSKSRGRQEIQIAALWLQLAKCYILGDMLRATNFCNMIIVELIALSKLNHTRRFKVLGSDTTSIRHIIANTTPRSPLRKILVDNWVATSSCEDLKFDQGQKDPLLWEFYKEVATQAVMMAQNGCARPSWDMDICGVYHVHPGQPAGYRCISLPPAPNGNANMVRAFFDHGYETTSDDGW